MSLLLAFQGAPPVTVKLDLVIVRHGKRPVRSLPSGAARLGRTPSPTVAVVTVLLHAVLVAKSGRSRAIYGRASLFSVPGPATAVTVLFHPILVASSVRKSRSRGRAALSQYFHRVEPVAGLLVATSRKQVHKQVRVSLRVAVSASTDRIVHLLVAKSESFRAHKSASASLGRPHPGVVETFRLARFNVVTRALNKKKPGRPRLFGPGRGEDVAHVFRLALSRIQVVRAQPSRHRKPPAVSILRVKHASDVVVRVKRFIILGRPPPRIRGPRGRMRGM